MAITDKKSHWLSIIFSDRVELPGNEGVLIPRGPTSTRPIPPKVDNGYMRYNTDLQQFEVYKQGAWTLLSTGAGTVGEVNDGINVGGATEVFRDKVGVDLAFRTFAAGSSMITITTGGPGGDQILIDSPAAALFLPLAGGQMTGDIEMLVGAQVLLDRNGTAANAALGFYTDADTGIYQPVLSDGYVSITNNSMPSWHFTAAGNLVPDVLNTGGNIGTTVDTVTAVHSDLYLAANGTGAAPAYSFITNTGVGMSLGGTGELVLSAAGTGQWQIDPSGDFEPMVAGKNLGDAGLPINNVWATTYLGGSAVTGVTNPNFTWLGDSQTGFYRPAAGTLGITIAGNDALQVNADGAWIVPVTTAGGNAYEDEVTNYGDDVLTNKKYVDDAIVAGAAQDYEMSFTNATLVAGVLTVNHLLNQEWPSVTVYDDNRKIVYPDVTSVDADNTSIDFSVWGVLSGTWRVKVIG